MKQYAFPLEQLTWTDVRDEVYAVNPTLAEIIDDYKPGNKPILKATYPFGSFITQNGIFNLPNENGRLMPFYKGHYSDKLRKLLEYNWKSVPFGVVTSGYAESFWCSDLVQPIGSLFPGSTFALRTILDKESKYNFHRSWNLTSGARMIFSLASLRDTEKLRKLQKHYQFRIDKPDLLQEQWNVFKKIFESPVVNKQWTTSILLFTKEWVVDILNKSHTNMTIHLQEKVLETNQFDRNRRLFDYVLDDFKKHIERKGIKIHGYAFSHLKQLIKVSCGEALAFSPLNTNNMAPNDLLNDAFSNIYKSKKIPCMMGIDKLDWKKKTGSIYYSLQMPLHISETSKRNGMSNIDDLIDIKRGIDIFNEEIYTKSFIMADQTRLSELPNKINLEYFHSEKDPFRELLDTRILPKLDSRFIEQHKKQYNVVDFSHTTTFLKGCVRITYERDKS